MRRGFLKGRVGGSKNQRCGPLRKIVAVLTHTESIFDPPRVQLECGHETHSWGQYKARCSECEKAVDPLDFPCPTCKAPPGLPCAGELGRTLNGDPGTQMAHFHNARVRRARKAS
jgi:hypothetical protein